jgi:hypothetical protein
MASGDTGAAGSTIVSEQTCAQDRDEFLAMLEKNRRDELEPVKNELDATLEKDQREILEHQISQIWDRDEELRATADHIWRDCIAHVRSLK